MSYDGAARHSPAVSACDKFYKHGVYCILFDCFKIMVTNMHDFPLITDLALILIAAGVTSVICRKLKLPILLGYILAGVLTGPHVSLLPKVHDMQNIETWSEIGVIFLLFALGLEFNFKSLMKVGKSGSITVAVIVSGMMMATMMAGHFLDWSLNTSIFMGGILCISSTMVIVKAFEELNLKGKPFTNIVYGVEIMEDIVGILLMVILSTIAIGSGSGDGGELVQKISSTSMRVVFFLVLWFVGGIFIVPTMLRKLKKYLDDEILMTISLALCLGMVMLAERSNLSTALGAFTIGSILGATTEAQRIEHLMTPIKNLFGAIFFVSVGMMVVPSSIVERWPTLLLLLGIVLVINPILGVIGVFISGKSLHESLNAGACFGQIGEFSFIIAKLGVSLAVLDEYTYPIVITISAITMITTPYVVRFSERLVEPVSKLLPERLKYRVEGERESVGRGPSRRSVMVKHFITETFILSMILLGIVAFMHGFVDPNLSRLIGSQWRTIDSVFISHVVCMVVALVAMTPFLSALILRRNKLNRAFMIVLLRGGGEKILLVLQFMRVAVAASFIAFALYTGSPFVWWIDAIIGTALLVIVMRFELVFMNYVRLERQFLLNYNEVELSEQENDAPAGNTESLDSLTDLPAVNLFSSDFSAGTYKIDDSSPFRDKSLIDLNLRARHNLFIIRIERDEDADVNIPVGQEILRVGDTIDIIGRTADLAALSRAPYDISVKEIRMRGIRQYSREMQDRRTSAANLRCLCIPIHAKSGFAGKTLRASGIGRNTRCLVIGIETCGRVEMNPNPDVVIPSKSRLWVIGESDDLAVLLEDNLTTAGSEGVAAAG